MTHPTSPSISQQPPTELQPPSRATSLATGFTPTPREWLYCLAAVLILSLAYLLMTNGRWHPGTDTAYYISISRSLAQGKGFLFNGGPVGKVPPLWPLLLAGAMKISGSFWFLNIIPAACLVISAACWYWILRRLVSPGRALATVLLSGMLFFSFVSAVQLRTEALFCLFFSAALLLGTQVGAGRVHAWRIAAAALLCGLMVGVRWTGLTCCLVVAAAIVSGQFRFDQRRRSVALTLVILTSIASFAGFRYMLAHLPKAIRPPAVRTAGNGEATPGNNGGALPEDMDALPLPIMQAIITRAGARELFDRVASSGKWPSSLLWMPTYLGVTSRAAATVTNPLGWFLIIMFMLCLWNDAANRRWIWIGTLLYCLSLVVRWKIPNPRYLVPVAPLIILGAWLGMEHLAAWCRRPLFRKSWTVAATLFVVSIGLCNTALWGVEVYIARSHDFYGRYMAGENDQLIAAAKYLTDRSVQSGQTAVNFSYVNLGRIRRNGQGWRSMHLLTDRGIRIVSKKICTDEPNQDLLDWAAGKGVKYYLYRPPVSPWRAHHFRIAWWQRLATGQKDIAENPSWVLYELSNDKATRIDLPDVRDWPTRVPGI